MMTKDDAQAVLIIADAIRDIQLQGWYAEGSITDRAIRMLRSAARHLARQSREEDSTR